MGALQKYLFSTIERSYKTFDSMKYSIFIPLLFSINMHSMQSELEKRQATNKVTNERSNTKYTNNLPDKTGSSI